MQEKRANSYFKEDTEGKFKYEVGATTVLWVMGGVTQPYGKNGNQYTDTSSLVMSTDGTQKYWSRYVNFPKKSPHCFEITTEGVPLAL